jgi:hypothetical protein
MPAIESLMLANHAEAINGLLYISGGGWSELWRGDLLPDKPPPNSHFGIAMSVLVPWTETNRQHPFTIHIEGEDGQELARVDGGVEMGRPPGMPPGTDQRGVLAVAVDVQFPGPGGYQIRAVMGDEERRVSFRVHDAPRPTGP